MQPENKEKVYSVLYDENFKIDEDFASIIDSEHLLQETQDLPFSGDRQCLNVSELQLIWQSELSEALDSVASYDPRPFTATNCNLDSLAC